MKVPFNQPYKTGREDHAIKALLEGTKFSGDGAFTAKCRSWFEQNLGVKQALLTTSCTHALEMAALLIELKPGDEVIMPSFTFVSTANPFVLRGAKIVFVDIRPDNLNIDESLIEGAITERTRAIVPVHYAGVSCEMDAIMTIAKRHNLIVIEDAAQCIGASYKGRALGTIGHMGALSFHDTKNIHCGEGGVLFLNEEHFHEPAEIVREKGTNRSQFLRGQIDKYSWVEVGSSYLPSEFNAAILYEQLQDLDFVTTTRRSIWDKYIEGFRNLSSVAMTQVSDECYHNGHVFYLVVESLKVRQELISYLNEWQISSVFHYVPLHSATAGLKYGRFNGEDIVTTDLSERMVRLPMHCDMSDAQVVHVIEKVKAFFGE